MTTTTLRDMGRSAVLAMALMLTSVTLLALTPTSADALGLAEFAGAAPDLKVHLGLHAGAAAAIWDAFMSPWAMALSLALIPLGFGSWAVTIRLTFQTLVKNLGKAKARQAALTF